ncbi:hypothetical protein PR048_026575 [Dryococelus australis]|uniref:Uncharacterized protein n=1 Tax=Dryococelus australis TaxID=614101 RepID=A0ABQ9GLP9_9NEOP|nr:hypothetical protein PR048_026575 [Dryococelus australis]
MLQFTHSVKEHVKLWEQLSLYPLRQEILFLVLRWHESTHLTVIFSLMKNLFQHLQQTDQTQSFLKKIPQTSKLLHQKVAKI